jgi:hypothetical protein
MGAAVQPRPDSPGTVAMPSAREAKPATAESDDARERFAVALHALLIEQGGPREWNQTQTQLLARYERLAREQKDLRLADGNTKGKVAVGAASVLSQRTAGRIEELIRQALLKKGYDPELVRLACERVHEQLTSEVREAP